MVNPSPKLIALPTRIDRYPAKMISHLATTLVDRYAADATHILDPFCGSGAVLKAGSLRGKRVTGLDLNPFGVLLTSVKLQGFAAKHARTLCETMLAAASSNRCEFPVMWDRKNYWFTPATLQKFETIRHSARQMNLNKTQAGRAVLLALGLSVRRCSRADQRSPKPFISKYAREDRVGRHFDPAKSIRLLLEELAGHYGNPTRNNCEVFQVDMTNSGSVDIDGQSCSHIITSPPYINAQDYFRNSKLELYILEGLLDFRVSDLVHRFIGTERGMGRDILNQPGADDRRRMVPDLLYLERAKIEQAVVVHRYLHSMASSFRAMKKMLKSGGTIVIVCGDNLIGGRRICTWQVLNRMLENMEFLHFDSFGDRIKNRAVAPMRCGHKGIIKEEMVSAFRLR